MRGERSAAVPNSRADCGPGDGRTLNHDTEILYLTEESKNYALRALINTTINTTIKI
jgi:hypothetical protein